MVRRRITLNGRYSPDWDTFIQAIGDYSPNQRAAMLAEATTSGRLTLIVAQAQEALDQHRILDRLARAARKTRYQRELPWRTRTPDETARRAYVDDTTAMMPAPTLHPRTDADVAQDAWRRHQPTRSPGCSVMPDAPTTTSIRFRALRLRSPRSPPGFERFGRGIPVRPRRMPRNQFRPSSPGRPSPPALHTRAPPVPGVAGAAATLER